MNTPKPSKLDQLLEKKREIQERKDKLYAKLEQLTDEEMAIDLEIYNEQFRLKQEKAGG
ncbi:MAG TPA: hypothetical protein VJS44_08480 [Pyrinomonadaceae bacterium]|nr:hypothetical protein [Pyrinomonadaceae bacterium]